MNHAPARLLASPLARRALWRFAFPLLALTLLIAAVSAFLGLSLLLGPFGDGRLMQILIGLLLIVSLLLSNAAEQLFKSVKMHRFLRQPAN